MCLKYLKKDCIPQGIRAGKPVSKIVGEWKNQPVSKIGLKGDQSIWSIIVMPRDIKKAKKEDTDEVTIQLIFDLVEEFDKSVQNISLSKKI